MESELQNILETQLGLFGDYTFDSIAIIFPLALGVLISIALLQLGLYWFSSLTGLAGRWRNRNLIVASTPSPFSSPTQGKLSHIQATSTQQMGSSIPTNFNAGWTANDYQQAGYIANGTPLHGKFEIALNTKDWIGADSILNQMKQDPVYKDYIKSDSDLLNRLRK